MIRGYGAEAIRAAEAPALEAGVPLMRQAAEALAEAILRELMARGTHTGAHVLVLAGGGNNGGDGLFAAANLARHGVRVSVAAVHRDGAAGLHVAGLAAARAVGVAVLPDAGPRLGGGCAVGAPGVPDGGPRPGGDLASGGASVAAAAVLAAAADAHVWVDAIAGIGVRGALREPAAEVVSALIALRAGLSVPPLVVAVDVPSGVSADSGALLGPVLPADLTLTMGGMKAGLLLPPAARLAGHVQVVDLGLGAHLEGQQAGVQRLEPADVAELWPIPGAEDHKYTRSVVGIVAGSERYPGAALLATSAAVRMGCGMVRYLGPARVAELVIARNPEVVAANGRVQCLVLGPGMDGMPAGFAAAAARALADPGVGSVWDAGALSYLPNDPALIATRRVLLTPHAGELAALLTARGGSVDRAQIEADPARWARTAAERTGATVLLKGAVTVIAAAPAAPAEPAWPAAPASLVAEDALISQADGTPWLASAGSGDVLAGILGALLAQCGHLSVPVVAAMGALVHGHAGRLASGGGPLTASSVAHALPAAIRALLAGSAAARLAD